MIHRGLPLLALALAPSSIYAQSQGNAGQELLTDLQKQGTKKAETESGQILQPSLASEKSAQIEGFQIGSAIIADTSGTVRTEFSDATEPFIGTTASSSELQKLAAAVAQAARSQGYLFASAYVPEQKVALGMLRVVVDLGKIDKVRIDGTSNIHLRQILGKLKGKSARKDEVERALLLARDIPGIEIKKTNFVRDDGEGVLTVKANERRATSSIKLDNYGDEGSGPVRARLETEYSYLFDASDQLAVGVTTNPAEPRELTFVSARYSNIVAANGTELSLTGAAGRAKEISADYRWQSRRRYLAAGISTPLIRSDSASLWLRSEFAFLDVNQGPLGDGPLRDNITAVTFSASGNTKLAGGRLSGGVSFTQGLDVFDATKGNDPLASRSDGSAVFSKEQLWLNWFGRLGSGFSVRLAGNGQIASRPLLASQEIGIGGASYGRAYEFYELAGENGAMGLAELRHATDNPVKFIDWIELYGFVDGGYVNNLRNDFNDGGLMSGGGGIRSGLGKAELGVEIALPVDDVRFATDDRSPRINLSFGLRF